MYIICSVPGAILIPSISEKKLDRGGVKTETMGEVEAALLVDVSNKINPRLIIIA